MSARALLLASLLLCTACAVPAAEPPASGYAQPAQLKGFPRGSLTITRAEGRDSFRIWIADTESRQQQGLMWVRQMSADQGMLFVLPAPRPMFMWMKNTYMSLDMVFFGTDGRVLDIVHGTKPLSEEIIPSGTEVAGVLEIRAGEARRRGIEAGDRLSWSAEAAPR